MTSEQTFVVVGGNLTAGAAVTTLRDQGFDQRIVVIGEEPHPPYERPPLSKQYLRGESTADSALLHPPSWYADADVELRLGLRAVRLDPVGRVLDHQAIRRHPWRSTCWQRSLLAQSANAGLRQLTALRHRQNPPIALISAAQPILRRRANQRTFSISTAMGGSTCSSPTRSIRFWINTNRRGR